MRLEHIDAVFLDAGNTLVGMDLEQIAGSLGAQGVVVSPDAIGRAEAAARPRVSRRLAEGASSESRDTFAYYVRCILDGLSLPAGSPPERDLAALATAVAHDLKTRVGTRALWRRVLPGVPEALATMRELGLGLFVVSNSDGTVERGLTDAGLAGLLDGIVDSTVVGFEKPDRRIFEHALALSKTAPERTAHVGDLHAVDVVGARGAGLHGVLLDPFGDWGAVDCPCFLDVAALARAFAAVDRR